MNFVPFWSLRYVKWNWMLTILKKKGVINTNNLLQCIDKGSDYKHWNNSKIMYD